MKRTLGILAVVASAFLLTVVPGASAAKVKTVEISGRAFVFNHMSTGISNATVKIREFPKLSAKTDALGDYRIKVPDDATVTPYIESGGPADLVQRNMDGEPTGTMTNVHWNEIDLQTFHTRGQDIENANLQTPRDQEYNALKAILQVPAQENGRPEQCAVVTTSSARNVRDVDFRTYWLNTPHGVEGATSRAVPTLPSPTYFNEMVIPDKNQPYSSHDGGIVWPVVPAGTYRIITEHPDTSFASFLVTCAPGRVVNANPPMGAYQLDPGEKPRTFSNVAAKFTSVKAVRKGKKQRTVHVKLDLRERIAATVKVKTGGKVAVRKGTFKPGTRNLSFKIGPNVKAKKARVSVRLQDAAKVSFTTVKQVALPKVIKKSPKKSKKRG